ncbi:MAG: hypothetical protein FD124_2926, partial [Alphaproteobacteria bacterium]
MLRAMQLAPRVEGGTVAPTTTLPLAGRVGDAVA